MNNNPRSSLFRWVNGGSVAIQFNGQELQLVFGTKEDLSKQGTEFFEEVGVTMQPTQAKFVSETLKMLLENYEATSGTKIPFPTEHLKKIEDAIQEANKKNVKPNKD